jgi:hypothetical protein
MPCLLVHPVSVANIAHPPTETRDRPPTPPLPSLSLSLCLYLLSSCPRQRARSFKQTTHGLSVLRRAPAVQLSYPGACHQLSWEVTNSGSRTYQSRATKEDLHQVFGFWKANRRRRRRCGPFSLCLQFRGVAPQKGNEIRSRAQTHHHRHTHTPTVHSHTQ